MQRETPHKFDNIRCYEPKDFPIVFEDLLNDLQFQKVIQQLSGNLKSKDIKEMFYTCKSTLDVQKKFIYNPLKALMKKISKGMDMDCKEIKDKNLPRTFISNHRDIVLDTALLSLLLIDNDFPNTQETAIGDNLLVYPWIKHVVRLNKAFIVKRSTSFRETLMAGKLLSEYMHYTISKKNNSIWIAQREGRAKDSNDKTQEAVLKMIAMGCKGKPQTSLLEMNITPLSISYEYDPCDYLKAREFQLKRDNNEYRKTQAEDLLNMQTGIMGYKGHVHYHLAPCINDWIKEHMDDDKTTFFHNLALHIDKAIYQRYSFFPCNYIAADLLEANNSRSTHYSPTEQKEFESYIDRQIAKIEMPNPDIPFLRHQLLLMYANPLFNNEKLTYQH